VDSFDYDFFVIGAGSGGVRASRMAASFGARVAVAEDRYLGGTCVNVGCVPKKLFVYASHYREDFEDARGFGWDSSIPGFDWPTLRDRKTKEIERLNGIYGNILGNAGVDLIEGFASIVDPHTVAVAGKHYSCKHILIATGGWPYVPEFPGSEHAITSNEVFYLETLPKKALVVGGGYIAVEFAGIFNGLGVETVQAYRGELFLRGFDGEVREKTRDAMTEKGVDLRFNLNVTTIEKLADDEFKVTFTDGSTETFNLVMYATGRKAKTEGLGLENLDLELKPSGAIVVDEHYQTSVPSVYALGDVTGRVELTPVALAEGMALANTLFNNKPQTVDYDYIATAVFCQPNIGTVGLTEEEARERYGDAVAVYKSSFTQMRHTMSGRTEKTFMKILVERTTDKVLGMHMLGPEAGEIIQGFAVALKAGATKGDLDSTIGIHPTTAEECVTMREEA